MHKLAPLVLMGALLPAASLHAAGPADPLLRTLAETRGFTLGRPVSPHPLAGGHAVLFLRSPARSPELSLYEYEVGSGTARLLISPAAILKGKAEKLSPAERARRERSRQSHSGITNFDVTDDGHTVLFVLGGRLFALDLPSGAPHELADDVLDPHLAPNGKQVAFVRDRDLYLLDLATGRERRLTSSDNPTISYGLAEFVAQEEMGRMAGMWWAPDSRSIAFEEADTTDVETFHLSDGLHPEVAPEEIRYPRAGKNNARVRLLLLPLARGATAQPVEWDNIRFPYLANVVWKSGGPLTFVVEDRPEQHLRVMSYKDGKSDQLLEEHDSAWLNLDPSVPRWLEDGSGFLWSTERDGAWQLELRAPDGSPKLGLTAAKDGYRKLLEVRSAASGGGHTGSASACVLATPDPTRAQIDCLTLGMGEVDHLAGGKPGDRSDEAYALDAVFSKDHRLVVIETAGPTAMPRARVWLDGKPAGELPSVAEAPPFSPTTEYLTVGGQSFHVAVTVPRNASRAAGKKWPVIVDVYGGPHHNQVLQLASRSFLRQWMADRGYAVVAIDGRGTPGRGRAWERALRGKLGTVPLEDQVSGLAALGLARPDLDLSRVGIVGWSFGGYLAALAVLHRPDIFRAAVAGAPVVDWHDYDTFYTERYLGAPSQNETAYHEASLLSYAGEFQHPLLLVHGTRDDNVFFFHSLKLARALIEAGRPFRFLPLPGLTHMVPDPTVRTTLEAQIMSLFDAALK